MSRILSPYDICKSGTEHAIQTAVFCWLRMAFKFGFDLAFDESTYSDIDSAKLIAKPLSNQYLQTLIFANPNGGSRGDEKQSRLIRGAYLKAEGVRSGVADISVLIPTSECHGLLIEMKKPKKGKQFKTQKLFEEASTLANYRYLRCSNWIDAALEIKNQIKNFKYQY